MTCAMEKVNIVGKIKTDMKVNGKKIQSMEKEIFIIKMARSIQDNGILYKKLEN